MKGIEMEKFDVKAVEEKPKEVDEDGNPIEPPAEDPDAPKKVVFNKADFEWTKTNNNARNIPQCYISGRGSRRVNCDQKPSSVFSSSPYEAVMLGLDEFMSYTMTKCIEDEDKGKPFCYR